MNHNQLVCFSKGTKVLLSNGLEKNIETIIAGDIVLNYNIEFGIVEKSIVQKVVASYHSIVNVISFNNETKIVSTPDHPYYVTGNGWCSVNPKGSSENYNLNVSELVIGDRCLQYKNGKISEAIIQKIETKVINEEMYVISGGKNNSFFANGILVHDENIMELNIPKNDVELQTTGTI